MVRFRDYLNCKLEDFYKDPIGWLDVKIIPIKYTVEEKIFFGEIVNGDEVIHIDIVTNGDKVSLFVIDLRNDVIHIDGVYKSLSQAIVKVSLWYKNLIFKVN